VGLAVVYRTVGDLATWSECLTVWPPMLWCAILVPRLVVLGVRRRGRELAASLGLLALFLAITMEWPRAGQGWGATMTEWMPVSRIDQCWATPDLRPLAARVVRGPSDHRALVVDLALPASPD
jgi:hypothetical protein